MLFIFRGYIINLILSTNVNYSNGNTDSTFKLAILDSKDIPHPPIEAVFTVDEEIGMGGAENIDLSVLKGKKLINIDSEEEGILQC